MSYRRVLTVQDISCLGQCSATVALPVLSVCGHETVVLPSSVLSTHTTAFTGYTFTDLSALMPAIARHWRQLGISFDAVYTGYQGNREQIECVKNIISSSLCSCRLVIVDPAMADNGRLYPGFDEDFVNSMKSLCSMADYILPNITEACLMTGIEYREKYDEAYIKRLLAGLQETGASNIVLTGVSLDEGTTGAAMLIEGHYSRHSHRRLPFSCHGTGDLFASAFTGCLVAGMTAQAAVAAASDFVLDSMLETASRPEHYYGPVFEPVLTGISDRIKKYITEGDNL